MVEMTRNLYHDMMTGLLVTVENLFKEMDFKDLKPELSRILNMVSFLEKYWNNNGSGFYEEDWKEIFDIMVQHWTEWYKEEMIEQRSYDETMKERGLA